LFKKVDVTQRRLGRNAAQRREQQTMREKRQEGREEAGRRPLTQTTTLGLGKGIYDREGKKCMEVKRGKTDS